MIFCVEDDSNIRELVVYTLESTGFKAVALKKENLFWKLWRLRRQSLFCLILCFRGWMEWSYLES